MTKIIKVGQCLLSLQLRMLDILFKRQCRERERERERERVYYAEFEAA